MKDEIDATLVPDSFEQQFEEINKRELTPEEESSIKYNARNIQKNISNMYGLLRNQHLQESKNHDWDKVMELTKQIEAVENMAKYASGYCNSVEDTFKNMEPRRKHLDSQTKSEIYHKFHGDRELTKDQLSEDYRISANTVRSIVDNHDNNFKRKPNKQEKDRPDDQ